MSMLIVCDTKYEVREVINEDPRHVSHTSKLIKPLRRFLCAQQVCFDKIIQIAV